jgi:hypothetical protein
VNPGRGISCTGLSNWTPIGWGALRAPAATAPGSPDSGGPRARRSTRSLGRTGVTEGAAAAPGHPSSSAEIPHPGGEPAAHRTGRSPRRTKRRCTEGHRAPAAPGCDLDPSPRNGRRQIRSTVGRPSPAAPCRGDRRGHDGRVRAQPVSALR